MNGLTKNEWVTLGAGIIIIIIFVFFGNRLTSPSAGTTSSSTPMTDSSQTPQPSTTAVNLGPNISKDPNIQIYDIAQGTGAVAKAGTTVTVNYLGTLQNGTKFDSSYDRNQPFSFKLGAGTVIKGWELGLVGMKVGGKRRLVISPSYGYGANPVGSIPANSTLVFDIELLNVQ